MPDKQKCEILQGFELVPCRNSAEGMDSIGVLVCRKHGETRKMSGGTYTGWFGERAIDKKSKA